MKNPSPLFLGLDLSDKTACYCVLDADGGRVREARIALRTPELQKLARRYPSAVWTLEAGTQSPWVDRLLRSLGIRVNVINPRRLRAVSDSLKKTDRTDAEMLAFLGRFAPQLLWQVRHRSFDAQVGLTLLKARDRLVKTRTSLINTIRGLLKSFGTRLPSCDKDNFTLHRPLVPEELEGSLHPLFDVLLEIQGQVERLEEQIRELVARHPVAKRLTTTHGVGPITSLAYVLVIDDPARFRRSRDVGSYLGLTTRIDQSGDTAKELRITKAGDKLLRTLLVQAAQCILRAGTRDSALKQWGLKLADRGGRAAKKKAAIAVARKLAVLLHRLWISGETYQPFPQAA